MTTVVIGTANPLKRDAIEEVFSKYFDGVDVTMLDVYSDVPKQPMDAQIMEGAENRIRNIKNRTKGQHFDFFVSVEAGIMRIGKRYYNMQFVMVENGKTGRKSTGVSQMLEVPKSYIGLAAKTSFNNVFRTIFGDDSGDGISLLTRGETERGAMIRNGAVMALAGQLNGDLW